MKLRTSRNPDYLRIVMEGAETDISKGVVNQKGNDIMVRFPHADIIVREEKETIPYKLDNNIIIFSPGSFSGFKSFYLKGPGRLVIDVYQKQQGNITGPSIEALRKQWRENAQPLVKPEQQQFPHKKGIKTIVIDPGHGGYESGIVKENYREKSVVLDIARRLGILISRGSRQGFLTRESDQFMSLEERLKFTNSRNADIFLSLHIGNHKDIVVYTPAITEEIPHAAQEFLVSKGQSDYIGATAAFRDAVQQAIISDFGMAMVSSKPLPYSIISGIEAAALIIELPSFKEVDYNEELKSKLANTIYRGISQYENSAAD